MSAALRNRRLCISPKLSTMASCRYSFIGMTFDNALRALLKGFRLPGEAQKIDRPVHSKVPCFRHRVWNSGPAALCYLIIFCCLQTSGLWRSSQSVSTPTVLTNLKRQTPRTRWPVSAIQLFDRDTGLEKKTRLSSWACNLPGKKLSPGTAWSHYATCYVTPVHGGRVGMCRLIA